ncbi:MAG: hypothetical protein IID38_12405, partial [Planctomycetes bacterium]|nr:hypothetical protein [Planctomycetota bacterium]
MATLQTTLPELGNGSVTERFVELADKLNAYLERFSQFGVRSNRAVAQYLRVDGAELSRLKNARVGDINLERAYEILAKCEELAERLTRFGGPLKCNDIYSVGYNVTTLPCISKREQTHAIALHRQTDAAMLTVDTAAQQGELDALLGAVCRSVVHPKRNPYGPMSTLYVLKSVYAAPSATPRHLRDALRVLRLGRRACAKAAFHPRFGEETRLRTLAVILNNGGGIALRIAKQVPERRSRMLRLSRHLHKESLATFYFAGTVRGALTCANDLRDADWAKQLLRLLAKEEGPQQRWPKGLRADLDDSQEWQFLKENRFWGLVKSD